MCDPKRLLTIQDAAQLLQLHPEVVRRWLREGRLSGVKLGSDWRLREADLAGFLQPVGGTAGKPAPGGTAVADDGPKMCVKFPKWLEFSGLPRLMYEQIGPEAWPVFKKLVELDFELEDRPAAGGRNDRRIALDLDALGERTGYPAGVLERVLTRLEESRYIERFSERQARYAVIVTPIRTPRLVIDIEFADGGVRHAPDKAMKKACLRRYLESSSA